ncbi:hypothetical protein SAMN02745163_03031 [Clostridium cavendishii DSM 21758]|uniref:Uncharacterized protein n=1 Tax=Clostridium cavendishii DSM 21758 TaxID=1121302 RepID=A0A1M6NVA2_9CLOT|nr:hypothetical protein [Clostridium cavendishii]SHJ99667.1 hypothetical protein SAMN02745163_03031 [Clostridium cavendishii DSM 21758]
MNFLKKKVFIIPVAIIIYISLFFISSKLGGAITLIGGFGVLFYLFKKNDKFKSKHILLKGISTGLIAIFTLFIGFGGLIYDPKEAKEIQLAQEKLKAEKQVEEDKAKEKETRAKEEKAKEDKENEEKAKKALEESAKIAENTKKEKEAEEAKKNIESQSTKDTEKTTSTDNSNSNVSKSNNSNTANTSNSSFGNSSAKDVTTNEPAKDNKIVYWVSKGKSYHCRSNCVALSRSKNILSGPASSCPKTDPCNDCIK